MVKEEIKVKGRKKANQTNFHLLPFNFKGKFSNMLLRESLSNACMHPKIKSMFKTEEL